jgi:hypothetical protein
MSVSPGLGITDIDDQQAGAEVTHNEAVRLLEVAAGRAVKDRDLTAPPGSESDGDAYIVKATGTGDWAGHDNKIAVYLSDTYKFITPSEGMSVYLQDENVDVLWNGSAWLAYGGYQTLTDASTIAWDASKGTNAQVTLSTNRTMGTPTNLHTGWIYTIKITQPGGESGATVTWPALFKFTMGNMALSSAANRIDLITFVYDGSSMFEVSSSLRLLSIS